MNLYGRTSPVASAVGSGIYSTGKYAVITLRKEFMVVFDDCIGLELLDANGY